MAGSALSAAMCAHQAPRGRRHSLAKRHALGRVLGSRGAGPGWPAGRSAATRGRTASHAHSRTPKCESSAKGGSALKSRAQGREVRQCADDESRPSRARCRTHARQAARRNRRQGFHQEFGIGAMRWKFKRRLRLHPCDGLVPGLQGLPPASAPRNPPPGIRSASWPAPRSTAPAARRDVLDATPAGFGNGQFLAVGMLAVGGGT